MESHPFIAAHGDYFTLNIAQCGVPHALIDKKLAEAMIACVLIGLKPWCQL
jgi:hypothetical protein